MFQWHNIAVSTLPVTKIAVVCHAAIKIFHVCQSVRSVCDGCVCGHNFHIVKAVAARGTASCRLRDDAIGELAIALVTGKSTSFIQSAGPE